MNKHFFIETVYNAEIPNSSITQKFPEIMRHSGGFLLLLLPMLLGCNSGSTTTEAARSTATRHQDLLVGYTLLADTLSKEAQLENLGLYKKLTLKAPNERIDKMMQTLNDASAQHASELARLRVLNPDVSGKPAIKSTIGGAITAAAAKIGKSDMTERSGGFDIRFVLLQAQATRMVNAIATATARYEPNRKRKAWLKNLASEYEGYRNNIVKYLSQDGKPCGDSPG